MTGHILNRSLPPRPPQPATLPKPKPDPKLDERLRKSKQAEAVGRAIARTTR